MQQSPATNRQPPASPNSWPFPDEVKTAFDLTRREMEEDSGESWPRLLTFLADGNLEYHAIDPGMMADWRDKNKVSLIIVRQCFRADVRCCIFLADSLVAAPPPGKTFEDMPRDFSKWPREYVREALIVTVNARGIEGAFLQAAYTRGESERRIFGDLEAQRARENRFSFDLRSATEYGAVCEALLRGRDGTTQEDA